MRRFGYSRRDQKITRRQFMHSGGRRWSDKYPVHLGEDKFVELVNSSSQGFLIHNFNFAPLFVNSSYADILGYTVDEIYQLETIYQFYSLQEIPRLKGYLHARRLKKHSKDQPPTIYEVQAQHKKGQNVILQHAVSLIDWHGTEAVLIAVSDITDRFMAQQALAVSEQRFRDFAETASDWCWEMDADLRFNFISDTFERISNCSKDKIIGYTREEIIRRRPKAGENINEKENSALEEHLKCLQHRESFSDFVYNMYLDDGSVMVTCTSGKPTFSEQGAFLGYRGAAKNITAEKELSEKLNFQATHDELTGLINRRHFDTELNKVLNDAKDTNNEHVLLYMDLDRFKIVNDNCGHMAGDELLQQLTQLFQSVFSRRDVLARLGGDEFAVIMRNCTIEQSMRISKNLHEAMNSFRFAWAGKTFSIGVSVGLATINCNSESASRLLQNVDSACYKAKDTGRNKTQIFSENDVDLSKRKGEMKWASRITQAIEEDAFTLHGQAIIPLQTSEGFFYELLVRMRDGSEVVHPHTFFPAAERYDLSLLIDKWVLRNAFIWINSNRSILETAKLIFVNLSGKTIGQNSFLDFTVHQLKEYDVPPEKICFEITETTAITNFVEATDFISKLKDIGCQFALDDFGSGVSSYAYLKNFPVDYLKIDGMFIRDMCSNAVNLAMVKSINEISHVMGKQTIAEFVENDATFAVLRNMGVDYAQGYAIHKPMTLDRLITHGNKQVERYLNFALP